jgi:hypothetical protein
VSDRIRLGPGAIGTSPTWSMPAGRRWFDPAVRARVPWIRPVGRFRMPVTPGSAVPATEDHLAASVQRLSRLRPNQPPMHSAGHPGLTSNGDPREQAYFPAEQPSSGQDPRLPSAHADPCGSRHLVGTPRQGPHRALRLRPTSCCPRGTGSVRVRTSRPPFGGPGEPELAPRWSWSTPTRPTRARDFRRGSVLLSPRPWAEPWSATGPSDA